MNTKHRLVLLLDDLIQIKHSEDWEGTSTPEQDKQLTEIVDLLDKLYFQYRNQMRVLHVTKRGRRNYGNCNCPPVNKVGLTPPSFCRGQCNITIK